MVEGLVASAAGTDVRKGDVALPSIVTWAEHFERCWDFFHELMRDDAVTK